MSFSSWSSERKFITVIFLFVLSGLLIALFVDIGWRLGKDEGERVANADSYARHATEDIEKCLTKVVFDPECVRKVVKTTNEHSRAESDLKAQKRMALWALGMMIVSGLTAVITAFGVWFVWKTLVQGNKINEATVAAAEAANNANEIMRGEQRPIIANGEIKMRKAGANFSPDDYRISFEWKNIGKGVARIVEMRSTKRQSIIDDKWPPERIIESLKGMSNNENFVLPPGESFTVGEAEHFIFEDQAIDTLLGFLIRYEEFTMDEGYETYETIIIVALSARKINEEYGIDGWFGYQSTTSLGNHPAQRDLTIVDLRGDVVHQYTKMT